jgi:hypothetical protein
MNCRHPLIQVLHDYATRRRLRLHNFNEGTSRPRLEQKKKNTRNISHRRSPCSTSQVRNKWQSGFSIRPWRRRACVRRIITVLSQLQNAFKKLNLRSCQVAIAAKLIQFFSLSWKFVMYIPWGTYSYYFSTIQT